MKSDTPPRIRLADYSPSAFLIDHVDMHLRLDGEQTSVSATLAVRRNSAWDGTPPPVLKLDVDGITAVSVQVDGNAVESPLTDSHLHVPLSGTGPWTVTTLNSLNPAHNTALSGLYLTNDVYCTQCEAEGFRRIIPFLDRPDVLATYRTVIEARKDQCPVLLSNGNPEKAEDLPEGWHRAQWHDPHPKPSYLFAVVAGALDCVRDSWRTMDGRDVALAIYVEPGKAERASFAMQALKRCIAWDEVRFGRAYDLDVFNIVAVSDFNLGAMENKGLNIFNDKYILASPETATDDDYQRIDAIIAHEYFHNWSGNRVTCRDWFQLCLKEGLTVYRDQEYTSDTYDRTIKRIEDVRDLWAHQFPEDGGPLAHAVRPDSYSEINNFYTATVYEKGAEIVRMVASWLGETRFRLAMDRYFSIHDGQAATLEDFLSCMEAEAGDLGPWPDFLSWYTQAGTPQVTVHWDTDVANGSASLSFEQTTAPTPGQPDKGPLPIPCRFALVDEGGADVSLADMAVDVSGGRIVGDQFLLVQAEGSVRFQDLGARHVRPSIFRDYSAPVALKQQGLDETDRLFLAARDSNAYNRWAQLQGLANQALQRRYHRLGLGEPLGEDTSLLQALVDTALSCRIDEGTKQATRAAELTLPGPHDLARTLGENVDPDRVLKARASLSIDLCKHHGTQMVAALEALESLDDGLVSPPSAARRSLITALLQHLAYAADDTANTLLERAHATARGMTMRIKTLGLMVKHDHPRTQEALQAFEDQFAEDPLAMDKWFAVQAAHRSATDVSTLEDHPSYDRTNPNRVRSLLGAFAAGNLGGFHALDGTGYQLLAARVGELDGINPQLAARLAATFRTWSSMDAPRQTLAKTALESVLKTPDLSLDTQDIVTRILKG